MDRFETRDFYSAAFLRTEGLDLVDARRDGNRVTFVFRDRPDRPDLLMAFFTNKATVRPLAFVAAIKELKGIIHNF